MVFISPTIILPITLVGQSIMTTSDQIASVSNNISIINSPYLTHPLASTDKNTLRQLILHFMYFK